MRDRSGLGRVGDRGPAFLSIRDNAVSVITGCSSISLDLLIIDSSMDFVAKEGQRSDNFALLLVGNRLAAVNRRICQWDTAYAE